LGLLKEDILSNFLSAYSAVNARSLPFQELRTGVNLMQKQVLLDLDFSSLFNNDVLGPFEKIIKLSISFQKVLAMRYRSEAVENTAIKSARKWGYEKNV